MQFEVTSIKITGSPDESGWTQTHEFTPLEDEKRKLRGTLYAIISTSKEIEGVERVIAGREIISRLHEEYFGKVEGSSYNALKDAVEKVIMEFGGSTGGIEISAVSVLDGVVYSAAAGGAKVSIFRGGILAEILESSRTSPKGPGVVSASGYPQINDVLILATNSFFEKVAKGTLNASLGGRDINYASELLTPPIHSAKDAGKVGVMFLKFSKKVRERVENGFKENKEEIATRKGEGSKAMGFWSFIRERMSKAIPSKRIYVRRREVEIEEKDKRKTALSVGFIILVLLFVSIVFGMRQKKVNEERDNFESVLSSAEHEFEEAVDIFSLNPERARELFSQSRKKVEELVLSGADDERLTRLKESIEKGRETVLGEYEVDSELFVDLSLLSDGFKGNLVRVSEEAVYVLDKAGEKVAKITFATKRSQIVAGPSVIDKPEDFTVYSDRVFILNPEGIDEVADKKEKALDKDWSSDALIFAYAGNIYVLEKGESKIFRFAGTESGFAGKKDWLTEGTRADLTNSQSWVIDGTVWVLDVSGTIKRFSLGNQVSFSASGVFPPLAKPSRIYTNEELAYLYVLEPEKERVVVLTKEGQYKAQYTGSEVKNAVDFGVSEKERKIVILTGDKLYSIELRHLE